MNEPVKLWIRSIALHTYWNIAREPDTFYSVDTEQDADTIVALKLGVREVPPAKAVRTPAPEPPTPPASHGRRAQPVAPMTASDFTPKE